METDELLLEVKTLLRTLEETHNRVVPDIDNGLKLGQSLRDAARAVGDSSSGSWVGWHSRMYFGDFEEPRVEESWDTEWGGVSGYSDRWGERAQTDVQSAIEQRAETTLADLAHTADRVREACQPLQREVLTILSPICDLAGLEKESDLLAKLEGIDWIVSPESFIHAIAPPRIMSRDSRAVSQGLQAPLHFNVEAAIVSSTSTLGRSRDFLDDAIRLVRQVQTKLRAARASKGVPQAAASEPPDARLARQLRRRSATLVVFMALAIAGGVVFILRTLINGRLVAAAIIVAAALLVAGFYALLVDRSHARTALMAAAGTAAAITSVEQLLEHFS